MFIHQPLMVNLGDGGSMWMHVDRPPGLDSQASGNAWAALRVLTDSLATQKKPHRMGGIFVQIFPEEMFQDSPIEMGDDGRND